MRKIDIRERLKVETQGHSMYNVRKEEYRNNDSENIHFRVSPKPLKLTKEQRKELENIGIAVCDYMDCCMELYESNESAHELLDRGKPDKYKNVKNAKYLFLRPDLILTESGFSMCEIETSPFGLALAEVLNRTYGNEGHNTIIHQNQLKNYVQSNVPQTGVISYSEKVNSFGGQLDFMAEQIFSDGNNLWSAKQIDSNGAPDKEIYRAFYLSEQCTDKNVENFLKQAKIYLPTSTPQFEEKALLSFIWDKRYSEFLHDKLGESEFELLRKIIPKTWVVGEEEYVEGGLPSDKQDSLGLADLGKASRKYVLKQSGFSNSSSWGEGVLFLHKMSGNKVLEMIKQAMEDRNHLYVIQEFNQGRIVPMDFIDAGGELSSINAKIRMTPYYAYMGKDKGKMIAAKVTGCENTEYIHASTASINTAVSIDERG